MAKNDLNMALGAKVVKIKVELDYKNSGLKKQVDKITKFLENKPVKLRVELEIKRADIQSQLSGISTRIRKFSDKLTIPVKIDGENIQKTMGKQMKEVERTSKAMGKAVDQNLNVSTKTATVKGANYIKQYTKQIKEAEKIMRSKTPDGKGLFSTHQFKDAKGNMLGFIATLEKANGVTEKLRYTFDKSKNAFQVVDRKTIDTSQKFFERLKKDLVGLEDRITKTGDKTKRFQKEYKSLTEMGKNGMLNRGMVDDFEKRLKAAQKVTKQEAATLDVQRKQEALAQKISALGKFKGKSGYKQLSEDAKTLNKEIEELYKRTQKPMKNNDFKKLNTDTTIAISKINEYRRALKEAEAIEKTKTKTLKDLDRMQRQSTISSTMLNDKTVAAAKKDMKKARTQEELNKAMATYNRLLAVEKSRSTSDSRERIIKAIQKAQHDLNMTVQKSTEINAIYGRSIEKMRAEEVKLAQKVRKRSEEQLIASAKAKEIARKSREDSIVTKDNRGRTLDTDLLRQATISQSKFKELVSTVTKGEVVTSRFTRNARTGLQRMEVQLERANGKTKKLVYELDAVNKKLYIVSKNEVFSRNADLGMFEQLRIAMERVPIWMFATGAFYGSIRGVRAMVHELLELDKALTELKRVASDNINIDAMLEGGIKIAKELGNNVMDVMNGISELARTFGDFNERQLLDITKTATLMANVSDLNAEEATQTLIGTMNAFNITASESIKIVDKLNEVDNNYAISTKQLSEGLSRTGATAKTFGVDLDNVVGHITAIGSVTMESGRIIGKEVAV